MKNVILGLSLVAATLATLAASGASAGAPPAQQPLSADEVKKVVDAKIPDLKACLRLDESPSGKLVVHYVILPSGKTEKPSVHQSSTGNRQLDQCIVDIFKKLEFPQPRGGATMEQLYPFTFAAPKVGKLEDKQVSDTISAHASDVTGCASRTAYGKQGALSVELDIAKDGVVSASRKRESTTKNDNFDACVLDAAKKWQFPKPTGNAGLTIAFPIALSAKQEPKKAE